MDFDGRAVRRPTPRQMDVSDWNVDVNTRNSVSGSVGAYQRDRSVLDARSAAADPPSRRLSSGDELRNDVRDLLRPMNRYDSVSAANRTREESPVYASSWRLRETANARASAPRHSQQAERVLESEPGRQRPQPRSIPSTRRTGEAFRSVHTYNGTSDEELGSRASAWGREREASPGSIETTPVVTREEAPRDIHQRTPSLIDRSPPREQIRFASPASTIRSDASTMLTSPPYTPSITDSPASIAQSIGTPPYTPSSSDDTSSRHPSLELPPPPLYPHLTPEPARAVTTANSSLDGDEESTSISTSMTASDNSIAAPSSTETTTTISPRQQREQLYDFRRNMRQVFARVDEMVDQHRDLFKSDALSGKPAFNAAAARETASFAKTTFEQLANLRQRFEEMTGAWENAASDLDRSAPQRQIREDPSPSHISDHTVDDSSISSRTMDSYNGGWSVEDSTSSDSTMASSRSPSDISHHTHTRTRWEPTLSSLTNDDDDSSSSASSAPASVSDACSSSLLSELPTISRPSTASSSAPSTRANVFEDFDRRMEEIRASLNAIAREKPRSPSSRTQLSTRSSTATSANKSRASSRYDDDGSENNACLSNRTARQDNHPQATTRHDREARLRQLLRELQTTGERLDLDSDSSSSAVRVRET